VKDLEIQDKFIPGTNIPRPRDREPYETDDHYVQEYLIKEYYSKYFPEAVEEYIKENQEKFSDINIENKDTQDFIPYNFSLENSENEILLNEDHVQENENSIDENQIAEEENEFVGENQEITGVQPAKKDLVNKKYEPTFIQKTKNFLSSIGKKIEKIHYFLNPLDYEEQEDFETGNVDLEDYKVDSGAVSIKHK